MLKARIPNVRSRHGTIDASPTTCDMILHWHEADPMVFLFAFVLPGRDTNNFWRGSRALFYAATVNERHAGAGDIRIGPLNHQTTMLHLITRQRDRRPETQHFMSIPTKPLRESILDTYDKVDVLAEAKALSAYIDNWLERVQSSSK